MFFNREKRLAKMNEMFACNEAYPHYLKVIELLEDIIQSGNLKEERRLYGKQVEYYFHYEIRNDGEIHIVYNIPEQNHVLTIFYKGIKGADNLIRTDIQVEDEWIPANIKKLEPVQKILSLLDSIYQKHSLPRLKEKEISKLSEKEKLRINAERNRLKSLLKEEDEV